MSWSELDIYDPEWEDYRDDCIKGAPIHSFGGLKKLLTSLGYHVNKAEGYKAIDVADVTMEEIRSGAIEFTDDGIFVEVEGIKRQIFLYKRDYHLELYGKPRFHIRKCQTIQAFMNDTGSIPQYRKANTSTVWVHDIDDAMEDKEVSELPLCRYCLAMAKEAYQSMNTTDFVELLKKTEETEPEGNVEVDLFGYTKDWETISRAVREQHNYTCECCGLHITNPYDQHYIHVHHKNGRKIDNRLSNLQCLCLRCHANVDDNHRERLINSGANRIVYKEFGKKYPLQNNVQPFPDSNLLDTKHSDESSNTSYPDFEDDLPF